MEFGVVVWHTRSLQHTVLLRSNLKVNIVRHSSRSQAENFDKVLEATSSNRLTCFNTVEAVPKGKNILNTYCLGAQQFFSAVC